MGPISIFLIQVNFLYSTNNFRILIILKKKTNNVVEIWDNFVKDWKFESSWYYFVIDVIFLFLKCFIVLSFLFCFVIFIYKKLYLWLTSSHFKKYFAISIRYTFTPLSLILFPKSLSNYSFVILCTKNIFSPQFTT